MSNKGWFFCLDGTMTNRIRFVALEGCIGAGKSEVLNDRAFIEKCANELHKVRRNGEYDGARIHLITIKEPLEAWVDVGGINALDRFYSDIALHASTFQTLVTTTMLSQWAKGVEAACRVHAQNPRDYIVVLYERSVESNRYVFSEMLAGEGKFGPSGTSFEHEVFKTQWQIWRRMCGYRMDAFLYLDVSPGVCAERSRKRARKGEEGLQEDYLARVCAAHDAWFKKEERPVKRVKVADGIPLRDGDGEIPLVRQVFLRRIAYNIAQLI